MRALREVIVCAALLVPSSLVAGQDLGPSGFSASMNLITGTSGSITGFPQSFNETRGVDVTVLSGLDLHVTSMTLSGLFIGSATSALVGARIYNSSSSALMASTNATITSVSGPITVPISAALASGGTYRVAFYVATTPSSQGSGLMFDPDPAGLGGFPYTETAGLLRINSAHEIATDAFPSNANIFVPEIQVNAVLGDLNWTSLGNAKAGTSGLPALSGTGSLSAGSVNQFNLTNGHPSSAAALFFGLSQVNAPFKGGVLVPSPSLTIPLGTNGSGTISLPFVFPSGIPPGTALYQQIWIQDAGATLGLSASNGLKGVTS